MARFGRAQPVVVFVPVHTPRPAGNHSVVTATDTIATITDVATRIVHTRLTATDSLAVITDTVTRLLALVRTASDVETVITDSATRTAGFGRTASDTEAIITDSASRISHVSLSAVDSLFALGDVPTVPVVNPTFTYLPAPTDWQPWMVPGFWQVTSWDSEVYMGGGLGEPPPVNTAILCAQVNAGGFTLKVWILASQVDAVGGQADND